MPAARGRRFTGASDDYEAVRCRLLAEEIELRRHLARNATRARPSKYTVTSSRCPVPLAITSRLIDTMGSALAGTAGPALSPRV